MHDGEQDLRRVLKIGDSKGVTFLKCLEETEFPTEQGQLLETTFEYEDGVPCLKVVPYRTSPTADSGT